MSHFVPGFLIKKFETKTGKTAEIRYPQWQDLEMITDYINTLSKEDTFVTFSGEHITKEEESKYLASVYVDSELGEKVTLYCFVDTRLVAVADIYRDKSGKKRSHHVGILGISVAKEMRGQGIGKELIKTVLEEAKKKIEGLKVVTLHVYSCNIAGKGLYEKLGFKTAGETPGAILYKDDYAGKVDMYLEL